MRIGSKDEAERGGGEGAGDRRRSTPNSQRPTPNVQSALLWTWALSVGAPRGGACLAGCKAPSHDLKPGRAYRVLGLRGPTEREGT